MDRKLTDVHLVQELVALNEHGEYDELIAKATSGYYHDFKHPPHVKEPKVQLVKDLRQFRELAGIRQDVLNCEYDECENVATEDVKDLEVTLIE